LCAWHCTKKIHAVEFIREISKSPAKNTEKSPQKKESNTGRLCDSNANAIR
jgi:hypothetical protein